MMKTSEQVNQIIMTIEQSFKEIMSVQTDADRLLSDAMLYSLNAGGKRIRPILCLEVAHAYGADLETIKPFAFALEMIHTYSLIHDDLPCMDDDDLRRGKPTSHVVYGEDLAILAGDALLNLSAEVMLEAVMHQNGDVKFLRAMHEILKASGASGMILGQVADIKYHDQVINIEKLNFINANKTGKLLTASIVSGALLGGASVADLEKLRKIGYQVGLLFQLVDDVLDVIGNPQKLGKRTQIDEKNNKMTYPKLMGIETTQACIRQYRDEIFETLDTLSIDVKFLKALVDFLATRDF